MKMCAAGRAAIPARQPSSVCPHWRYQAPLYVTWRRVLIDGEGFDAVGDHHTHVVEGIVRQPAREGCDHVALPEATLRSKRCQRGCRRATAANFWSTARRPSGRPQSLGRSMAWSLQSRRRRGDRRQPLVLGIGATPASPRLSGFKAAIWSIRIRCPGSRSSLGAAQAHRKRLVTEQSVTDGHHTASKSSCSV